MPSIHDVDLGENSAPERPPTFDEWLATQPQPQQEMGFFMKQMMEGFSTDVTRGVTQLSSEVERLRRRVVSLEEQLSEQNDRLDTHARGTAALFPTMKEPEPFSGNKGEKFDDWTQSMALWLRHRNVFLDDAKIETALTFLKGEAKSVMRSYYEKVADGEDLGSYENFIEELRKNYQETDKKDRAIAELNKLCNQKGTNSKNFGEFSSKFRSLAKRTGFSNEELLHKLYAHVPQPVATVLYSRGRSAWPTKWEDFLKYIQDVIQDQRLLSGQILASGGNSKDPDAMDVDTVSGKASGGKKSTSGSKDLKKSSKIRLAMPFEEAKRRGVCTLCAGKNHKLKECPGYEKYKKQTSNSANSSTSSNKDNTSKSGDKGKGKDKEKDKETGWKKKQVRQVADSDEESKSSESSDESSEEESPPPKKKSSKEGSIRKAKVSRIAESSEDEARLQDFLDGPQ